MDKYNLYDRILNATYVNIASQSPSQIYFPKFNHNSYSHKTFLKVAFMVASFENKKIYLNCKFFDFLKILWDNYSIKEILTGKCRLRFTWRERGEGTDIDFIAAFEAKEFQTDIGIFEEIWKEYYEK